MRTEAQKRFAQTPRGRFQMHKGNAGSRGITFNFTFDEWWELWQSSGKWGQRGSKRGQYCMARHGDQGAYEAGNVSICLNEENRGDRNRNYPMQGEDNPAFGQNYWASAAEEDREQRRTSLIETMNSIPNAGRPRSADD